MLVPTKGKPKKKLGDGKEEVMTIETEAAARRAREHGCSLNVTLVNPHATRNLWMSGSAVLGHSSGF